MESWMEDELVQSIPKEKLLFMANLMQRKKEGDPRMIMRQMLPLIREAKQKGLQFNAQEVSSVIAAIRKHSSPEENLQIDELLKKVNHKK